MQTRFDVEKFRNSVNVRQDNKNLVATRVTQRVCVGIHAVSAIVLLATIAAYSGITRGTNYEHFTSWSFMLATLYVITDFWTRKYTSTFLAPLAFSVSQTVACMTASMFVAKAGIISDSRRDHSNQVVSLMNVVLHVIPALIVLLLVASSRSTLRVPSNYVVRCLFLSLAFSSTYFLTFSPKHQYKVLVSNTIIRVSVVFLHSLFSVIAAVVIPYKFKE